ncbi:deoxyribonuclease gamma-like [Conger conger]|uniref:deoxyribonuclease gamma-like n=1 Tax=Conger conger TaxID=82655 RepID=UPI002A5A3B2E|nr:deoxyribonuclease gamma-like [Conger conger]
MRSSLLLFTLLGLCLLATSLKICAFNVRSFGEAKANNRRVMALLVKIIARCDLCLVQEVRDSKGTAIPTLVRGLNSLDKSHSYSHVDSKRLGRNAYKEQYVYIYRTDMLHVQERFQYESPMEANETDVFSRDPFIVWFHSPNTLVKDFILVGQHTCPKNAMREMDELYTVFQAVLRKWKTENVMFLGDLNAACGYVTIKGWGSVRLRSDPKFHWLIGDKEDTTVREKTHCAYDRIVVRGKELLSGIVANSAQPFNFKREFQLTEEEALEVSDHYPVEVDLKPSHRYLLHHEL